MKKSRFVALLVIVAGFALIFSACTNSDEIRNNPNDSGYTDDDDTDVDDDTPLITDDDSSEVDDDAADDDTVDDDQADDDAVDDDAVDDDAIDDDIVDDDATDDDTSGDDDATLNVIESEDPGASLDCEFSNNCIEDYLDFIDLASAYADPISEEQLHKKFDEAGSHPLIEGPIPYDAFRNAVIEILNIGFLLNGIDQRPLEVIKTGEEPMTGGRLTHYIFRDPYVGSFEADILWPVGEGPFPFILGIHGHGQTGDAYRRDLSLYKLQEEGYAVLLPTMRVNGADEYEDLISREMLLNGFTLMGIRLYETMLCYKYMRYKTGPDAPIGLMGHSGGSVNNNVLMRLTQEFIADVSDCTGNFNYDWNNWILDEAVPDLVPYHALINDFSTSSTPMISVPYEYVGAWDDILAFFAEYLP